MHSSTLHHHFSDIPYRAQIKTFLGDIATFYTSYTEADTFNFTAAKEQALTSASINSVDIVTALQSMEDTYTFEFETGLLGGPDSFMSALRNVASPFPFSTDVLSQATGLFRGYMSLVSVKLLDARNIQPVTPVLRTTATSNMNATSTTATRGTAAVAGAVATITQAKLTVTATATTTDNNNADTAGAPPPSTATATAMGIRTAPRNPKLMIIAAVGAAAAAASMFGIMINAL